MNKKTMEQLYEDNKKLMAIKDNFITNIKTFDLGRFQPLNYAVENVQLEQNKLFKAVKNICIKHNHGSLELQLNNDKCGEEVSVYQYFKKELEKETNTKLELYRIVTPFQQKLPEFVDDTWLSEEKETLVDEILLPANVSDKFFDLISDLSVDQYNKIIKELPYAFVLKREWQEGAIQPSINVIAPQKYFMHFSISGLVNNTNMFVEDVCNKDNSNYNKIVLCTLAYWDKLKNKENKEILEIINHNQKEK